MVAETPLCNISSTADLINIEKDDHAVKKPVERASWGSQIEFLLTCVGFAVGLGNLWRFPYLAYRNGGGAFLIPYTIMLLCVGVPLFYLEMALGQFASLGPVSVWKINGLFKGVGWASLLVVFCVSLYYNVVIAYCLFYFCASFTSKLPWDSCDNEWNTENCFRTGNMTQLNQTEMINDTLRDSKTPTEEYFYNHVLSMSPGLEFPGELRWQLAVCLLAAWMVVMCALVRGIKSLGKVMYFAALFPYVLLTILLVRGLTLPGSEDGIRYYLTPDWGRLLDSRVWSDAAVQIFYSLGCCTGGIVAMSSFNKFHHNCRRDALLVPLINCLTSVFAGLVIFSMLGFMAREKGVHVSEVATGGPGLVFVVYPEGISKMPFAPVWAVLFFLMMLSLGFGSQFSLIESVISGIADEYRSQLRDRPLTSTLFRVGVIVAGFVLGLPMCLQCGMYIVNLIDTYAGGFPLLVIGLTEIIATAWIYGFKRFADDIYLMLGTKPGCYWYLTWCYISPAILLSTIVFLALSHEDASLGEYRYPAWALALGWMVGVAPMVIIVGWAAAWYCRRGGAELCRDVTRPSDSWGPALTENRTGRYDNTSRFSSPSLAFINGAYLKDADKIADLEVANGKSFVMNITAL